MDQPINYQVHPTWWTGQEDSTWDRVKEALKRDWEQTKADLSIDTARELHQNAADTVKQALGIEPLPLPHQPTQHATADDADDDDDDDNLTGAVLDPEQTPS